MICCENVVKILWTQHFFFNSSTNFNNLILFYFFSSHFRQCHCHNCYLFFIPLFRQWHCHNQVLTIFFFSLFRQCHCHNYFATNFFFPISAMALSQLVCHKIFFYFGNAIATNPFHFFFLRNDTCTQFLQQILSVRLLLLD